MYAHCRVHPHGRPRGRQPNSRSWRTPEVVDHTAHLPFSKRSVSQVAGPCSVVCTNEHTPSRHAVRSAAALLCHVLYAWWFVLRYPPLLILCPCLLATHRPLPHTQARRTGHNTHTNPRLLLHTPDITSSTGTSRALRVISHTSCHQTGLPPRGR